MLRGSLRTGFAPRDYKPANPELWDGCVAAWCPALGPTGHALHDHSGSGYDGEVKTSGTQMSPVNMWNVDDGDWALTFRNTGSRGDNHVKIRSSSQDMIDPTGQFGVSLWVRRTLDSAFDGFISFGDNFNNSFNLNHQVNDRFSIMCNDQSGLYIFEDSTADRSSDFTWHHLVATSDGSGLTIWVDGVKGDTGAVPTTQSNASAAYLGKMYANDASQHGLTGRLDDIRVYNRPLCDEEIALLGQRRAISYEYRLNYQFPLTPATPINVNGTVVDASWETHSPELQSKVAAPVADSEWDTLAPVVNPHRPSTVAGSEWDTHASTLESRYKEPDRDYEWEASYSDDFNLADKWTEGSSGYTVGRLQDATFSFDFKPSDDNPPAAEVLFSVGDTSGGGTGGGLTVGVSDGKLSVRIDNEDGWHFQPLSAFVDVTGYSDTVALECMVDVQYGLKNNEGGRIRLFVDGLLVDSATTKTGDPIYHDTDGWFSTTGTHETSGVGDNNGSGRSQRPHLGFVFAQPSSVISYVRYWADCNVGDQTYNGQADGHWDTQAPNLLPDRIAVVADAEFDTHAPAVLPVNDATVADAEWDTHAPSTSVGISATVADAEWDVLACTTATEHPSIVSDAEWDTLAPTTQPKLNATVADAEWDTLACSTVSHAEASVSDAEWDTLAPSLQPEVEATVADAEWDTLPCTAPRNVAASVADAEWDTATPTILPSRAATPADAEWDTHVPSLVAENAAPVADAEWDTHAGSITRVVSASVADAEWDTHSCEVAAVFLATVAEAEWDTAIPSMTAQQSAPVADAEWDTLQASLPRAIESTVADAEWDVQPGMLPLRIPSVEADVEWDTQESRFALPYNATLANSNWEARLPFVGPDLTLQAAMSLTARLCPYAGEFLEFANEDAVSGSHKSETLNQHEMKSGSLSNTEMSGGSLSTAQMIRVGGTTLPTA